MLLITFEGVRQRFAYLEPKQFPLLRIYGVTVHKARGAKLESATIDIDESRAAYRPGMAYVAMSRCRKIQDPYVTESAPWSQIRPNWEAEKAPNVCRERSRQRFRRALLLVFEQAEDLVSQCRREEVERYLKKECELALLEN